MPKPPYLHEFRARIVELVRAGERTVRSIAQEFGVTDTTIRNWVRQADLDQGRRHDGVWQESRAEPGGRGAALTPAAAPESSGGP